MLTLQLSKHDRNCAAMPRIEMFATACSIIRSLLAAQRRPYHDASQLIVMHCTSCRAWQQSGPQRQLLCRTLTNGRSEMLTAMFTGDLPLSRTLEGRLLIDRDGNRFGAVLSYLRAGECDLPTAGRELAKLLEEAMFYQVLCRHLRVCWSQSYLLKIRHSQVAREPIRPVALVISGLRSEADFVRNVSRMHACCNARLTCACGCCDGR